MKTAIIMPAYKPDEKMITFLDSLLEAGMKDIIIINDGSGEPFEPIFAQAAAHPEVTLLIHEVNKGKGAGLKTAFKYLSENRADIDGAITCDADGQHNLNSIQTCLAAFEKEPDSVIIGGRDFKNVDMPFHNLLGNRISSVVYRFAIGIKLKDTQTGLRVIPAKWFELLSDIKGDRYEYETSMFIAMMNNNIPYREVPIETIYIDDNASSHFNVLKDSFKIYKIVLGYFFKFVLTSLSSWVIDIGIYYLTGMILDKCFATFAADSWQLIVYSVSWRVTVCTLTSRVISSIFNFLMNRKTVFKSADNVGQTAVRYYILAVCQLMASLLLVDLFADKILGVSGVLQTVVKCVVDFLLFILSYTVQRKWVFKNKK